MKTTPYILAFDLGGTKIGAAVFDLGRRRLGAIQSLPTMARHKTALTLMNLKRVGEQARLKAGVAGAPVAVGMGSTGGVDSQEGRLFGTEPLPNLQNFPIAEFIESEFGSPLHLENDANCFALGEATAGAGRGHDIVLGITLGTGFGCGIVMGGSIYRGASGNAGEMAYCTIDGGSYDEMLSGAGVQRFYERIAAKTAPTPKEIGQLAEEGDEGALKTWAAYGEAVGHAVSLMAAVVDPSICVIGGAVARRLSLFRASLEEKLRAHLSPQAYRQLRVAGSELDSAAGVTGAAEYALQRIAQNGHGDSLPLPPASATIQTRGA
jgi:glucokinase